jgi:hypothetical protein
MLRYAAKHPLRQRDAGHRQELAGNILVAKGSRQRFTNEPESLQNS